MEQIAKYIYQVYIDKSFTIAAKNLFISQPALSAAISRREKELGVKIFDRSKQPIMLTPHGRIYIESIEEIRDSESNMRQRMREVSNSEHNILSVGGNNYSSYFVLPEIFKVFHKQNPDVKVNLDMGSIGTGNVLHEKLRNDEIDLVITYHKFEGFIRIPIIKERYIIAMHKDIAKAYNLQQYALTRKQISTRSYDTSFEIEDMSIFKNVPFLPHNKSTLTHKALSNMVGNYKVAPFYIRNARHNEMHYNLMQVGLGAMLTTDTIVSKNTTSTENLMFFVSKSNESFRMIYLVKTHHSDNNPIVKNFIQTAKEVYNSDDIL